jgi:hypothetical protein
MKRSGTRTCIAAAVALCALAFATGCSVSLFSGKHYHYHKKCSPKCRLRTDPVRVEDAEAPTDGDADAQLSDQAAE